ncbi:MAG: hypothetical protein PVG83_07390 [Acidimicrobiia bacterium]|jgi:hypothetical protein
MRRRALAVVFALALVTLVSGCDQSSDAGATVELTEFSITGPQSLPGDIDRIDITNVGEFTHTLVVTDADGEVAAASGLIPPGESMYLDLDLKAGQYVFTCRMIAQDDEGNLIDHFEAGMHTGVVVEG